MGRTEEIHVKGLSLPAFPSLDPGSLEMLGSLLLALGVSWALL